MHCGEEERGRPLRDIYNTMSMLLGESFLHDGTWLTVEFVVPGLQAVHILIPEKK